MGYRSADVKALRMGYFEDDGLIPVTPETRQAVQAAVRALQKQGFDVRPFRPKGLEQARKLWWTFFVRCGAMFVDSLVKGHESDLSPMLRGFLQIAHAEPPLTADELLNAWAECDVIRGKLLQQMQEYPGSALSGMFDSRVSSRRAQVEGGWAGSRVPRRDALHAVV